MANKNAPGRNVAEGVNISLASDVDAYSIANTRVQFLAGRFGLSINRAALVAALAFGELAHV